MGAVQVGERWRALEIELDTTSGEVRRGAELLPLPPRAVEILTVLTRHPGELVSRDAIRAAVWNGAHVDFDRSLNLYISLLRKAFGDDAREPRYIETVARKGYRFIAPLEEDSSPVRIVVLPFESLGQTADAPLSDGLTDELILQLGRIGDETFTVVPRTTSSSFKKTTQNVAAICRECHATHLVEGSVRREGNEIRIVARLVRARDESLLWSHVFQERRRHLLEAQSRVARAIATEVRLQLSPHRGAATGTVPAEAYALYQQGRHLFFSPQNAPNRRALEILERAVTMAPGFAAPRRLLAEALLIAASNSSVDARKVRALVDEHAERALAAEPEAPESSALHAFVRAFFHWDRESALEAANRAIDLGGGLDGLRLRGMALMILGHFDEGLASLVQAVELDPLSLHTAFIAGWAFHLARRYPEAIDRLEKTVAVDPTGPTGAVFLANSYLHQGDLERADELITRRLENSPGPPPMVLGFGASILARSGQEAKARSLAEKLASSSRSAFVDPYYVAAAHAGLGEIEAALRGLERAADEGSRLLVLAKIDSFLDPLRREPRFDAILRGAGVPEWALSTAGRGGARPHSD